MCEETICDITPVEAKLPCRPAALHYNLLAWVSLYVLFHMQHSQTVDKEPAGDERHQFHQYSSPRPKTPAIV